MGLKGVQTASKFLDAGLDSPRNKSVLLFQKKISLRRIIQPKVEHFKAKLVGL